MHAFESQVAGGSEAVGDASAVGCSFASYEKMFQLFAEVDSSAIGCDASNFTTVQVDIQIDIVIRGFCPYNRQIACISCYGDGGICCPVFPVGLAGTPIAEMNSPFLVLGSEKAGVGTSSKLGGKQRGVCCSVKSGEIEGQGYACLLYTSPSPRD